MADEIKPGHMEFGEGDHINRNLGRRTSERQTAEIRAANLRAAQRTVPAKSLSILQIELAAKAAYEARRERVFKAGSGEPWDWQDITPIERELWREVAKAVFASEEDE